MDATKQADALHCKANPPKMHEVMGNDEHGESCVIVLTLLLLIKCDVMTPSVSANKTMLSHFCANTPSIVLLDSDKAVMTTQAHAIKDTTTTECGWNDSCQTWQSVLFFECNDIAA
jgi:hypothetical protein